MHCRNTEVIKKELIIKATYLATHAGKINNNYCNIILADLKQFTKIAMVLINPGLG